MDVNQKYIARIFFKLEIYQRRGQSFEDFFTSIMSYRFRNFKPIKPFGRLGDRKNDGFDTETGSYYQVYAPEDLTSSLTEAIKKLKGDFTGLHQQWNEVVPINYFHFVVKDDFKGMHPNLEAELKLIEKDHPNIKCHSMIASDLERLCFELQEDEIMAVLGHIPSLDIEMFDDLTMKSVVTYLLNVPTNYKESSFPKNPDFDQKIVFNALSTNTAMLLKYASFKEADLKEYFKYEDPVIKERLRSIFTALYQEGRATFGADKPDEVFFYILKKACKEDRASIQDAVLVLMSYYFSYCDIFEEPTIGNQGQLFNL